MTLARRRFLRLFAGAAILPTASGMARAETFPSRPISIVVPFPAGGPTDTLGRILADRMKRALGQSVIVEDLTGAAGTVGSAHVARAAPDGYTLILGHWQTHVVNGATFALQFDVVNDFEPISLIADCPMWVVGSAAVPANNLKELIAWLKENPGKATVGIGGVGGGANVVGTYFQKNTGTQFQFVPYRGAAPIIQDLLAGHIDLTFTQVASALAQVRSGQLKAYVVMAKTRWAEAPDTPTIDEEGVPGTLRVVLARSVGAQGHAKRCHRQARCRGRRGFGRSCRAAAVRRDRSGSLAARQTDAGGARRAAEGRDREVVADHQGGRHQGGISRRRRFNSSIGGRHEARPPQILASGRGRRRAPGHNAGFERTKLSRATGTSACRLSARRHRRPHRAANRSMAVGTARSAIRDREPAWRRQQYRDRAGREGNTRRLHAAVGELGQRVEHGNLRQTQFQFRARHRARSRASYARQP